jgi:hypothetical protein
MALVDEKNQIVSKERVLNHGEVYTADREVNAMLDLVKHETERIESRFLEPACGSGNFLRGVLKRKLDIVDNRYKKNQIEFERYAILAVSSIYGIDILEDNVVICRERLYKIFSDRYKTTFKDLIKQECLQACKYILEKNIIHGDALTLKTVGSDSEPIIFPEWSPVNGNMVKRRDFTFHELLSPAGMRDLPLFSDMGENVFISTPVREYPVVNFLKVLDVDNK